MNRRGSTRIAVRLGCHVVWPLGSGRLEMYTENISRHGMLLGWDTSRLPVPVVNDMLIINVLLPELDGFEPRCVRCQATVARIHRTTGDPLRWLGLRIHAMDFQIVPHTVPQ